MNASEFVQGLMGAAGVSAIAAPILPPEIQLYSYTIAGGCLGSIFGASIPIGDKDPTVFQTAGRGIAGVALAIGVAPWLVVRLEYDQTPEVLMGVSAVVGAFSYGLAYLSGKFISSVTIQDIKDLLRLGRK